MSIVDFINSLMTSKEAEEVNENAVGLLKGDHRVVESLFAKFESSESAADKRRLIKTIIDELTVHAKVEEKLIYPVLDKVEHEMAGEAVQEHHVVKFLLRELKNTTRVTDEIEAKVKVLKEIVQHHVKEEESEMFPQLEKSDADLEALGEQVKMMKKQLKAKAKSARKNSTAKTATVRARKKPTRKAS